MKKFINEKWVSKKLGEICSFKNGFNFNKGYLETGLKVVNVFDFQDFFSPKYHSLQSLVADKIPSDDYLLKKNDIVFVRSNGNKELIGRTLFMDEAPFPITFSAFCIRARVTDSNVFPKYLVYFAKSELFKSILRSLVRGTNIGNISQSLLSNVTIPIPSLEEQKTIIELLESIEQNIVYAETQKENLNILKRVLVNSLASDAPAFGNLINEYNKTKCLFSNVSNCIEEYDKTPLENGLTRFVGLENIQPENFRLQGFGIIEDGTTFTKIFKKGDVLFGKRRAYLKKVAIADYDGLCSSDILVFRAITEKILPELLPYYVSSDAFINLAVSTSAGSLSPRTKWKDLKDFRLSIPDLKTQETIICILKELSQSHNFVVQQIESFKKLKQNLMSELLR